MVAADTDELIPEFQVALDAPLSNAAWDAFMGVAGEQMNNRRDRRHLNRLENNHHMSRHASGRAYNRYLAAGGESGNMQGFFQWLVDNWDSILKMIMSIISPVGGAAGAAPMANIGPVRFTVPPLDVDGVTELLKKVEEARKVFTDLAALFGGLVKTIPGLGG